MNRSNDTCSIVIHKNEFFANEPAIFEPVLTGLLIGFFGHEIKQCEQIILLIHYKGRCEAKRFPITEVDEMNKIIHLLNVHGIAAKFEYRRETAPRN